MCDKDREREGGGDSNRYLLYSWEDGLRLCLHKGIGVINQTGCQTWWRGCGLVSQPKGGEIEGREGRVSVFRPVHHTR